MPSSARLRSSSANSAYKADNCVSSTMCAALLERYFRNAKYSATSFSSASLKVSSSSRTCSLVDINCPHIQPPSYSKIPMCCYLDLPVAYEHQVRPIGCVTSRHHV